MDKFKTGFEEKANKTLEPLKKSFYEFTTLYDKGGDVSATGQ
ncbi:MAG: hypothetical protein WAK17_02735 [Candidatus Nitrosopolaris sp.]|jgi:hypothetical protein